MNRFEFILIGFILICCTFSSQILPQDAGHNQDSLRVEIRGLLDKVWELYDSKSACSIDSAQNFLDSVLSIAEQNFEFNDTIIAITYNNISKFHLANLEYELSMKFAHMALDVLKESPGRNHIIALNSYDYLVDCCLHLQELVLCEEYCDKRFEILDNLGKPLTTLEAEQMVGALNDRARLLELQNRHEEAINDLERGIDLITDEMEEGPRRRVGLRANIAWILGLQNKWAESKEQLLEVLELAKEVVFPPKDQLVLGVTGMLAGASFQLGEYEHADSLVNTAIAIWEEIYGTSRPPDSEMRELQAYLRLVQGRDEEAVELAMRAVAYNREYIGNYPTNKLMGSLETAGKIAMATGNWELANELFDDLLGLKHTFLNTVFGYASESQKLNYIAKYPMIIHTILSGAAMPSGNSLSRTALNMVLCGKGIAIDAVAAEQAAAICSADPYLDSLIEKRRDVCSEIAGLFGSAAGNDEHALQRMSKLYNGKDEIETELSLSCSRMQLDYIDDNLTTEMVATKLPERSVLWEIIKYARSDITKLYEDQKRKGLSYLVMALTPDENIVITDLGDASVIDSLVEEYHDAMSQALHAHFSDENSQLYRRYAAISNQLYNYLISPLAASLADIDNIYVAADGMLNLLPFETLTGDGERFLIEDYEFVYLTSGRDLLKEEVDLSSNEAFVLADPDYMIHPTALPALATSESALIFAHRGNSTTPECLGSMFSPLPMTRHEGISVAELLDQTGQYDITFLESSQARERVLKNLEHAPSILHIATHGYFCEEAENPYLSNPLLRSGLILAGANRTIGEMNTGTSSNEDGILTAMEVSGLNLIGTDLVVLSACQTGTGDVQNGEGVFGLRRAFQHAGAKSVIMSMFAVPDESTADLMERFYANWLSGLSKSSALRNASLSILNQRRNNGDSAHPLFWGGFILIGDPD